jgi:hypothetical protein
MPSRKIPYHTSRVYIRIVHGPPTDACQGIAWKTCTRVRLDPAWLFDHNMNFGHSWGLRDSRMSCCQVYPLQGYKLVRISTTPSERGDGLITVFKCSNSTSYCYDNHVMRMTLTTFLVNELLLNQILTCYICMSRIVANLFLLITLIWLKQAQ